MASPTPRATSGKKTVSHFRSRSVAFVTPTACPRFGVSNQTPKDEQQRAAIIQRRETELLIELRRFRHLAEVQCLRSQFVQHRQDSPSIIQWRSRQDSNL